MEPEILQVVFLMYDGIKQVILDTFQTLQWKKCLWQLLWIYQILVLHLEGKTFSCMLFDLSYKVIKKIQFSTIHQLAIIVI